MGVLDAIKGGIKAIGRFIGIGESDTNNGQDSAQEWIGELDQEISAAGQRRGIYERNWFQNLALLMGQHYIKWNTTAKLFEPDYKVPIWREQITLNKILPWYRQAVSDILAYEPKAVVTPNSNETLDIDAAILGTKVLGGLKIKTNWKTKKFAKTEWQLTYGNAFLHPFWNERLGIPLPVPDQQPQAVAVVDEAGVEGGIGQPAPVEQQGAGLMTGDVDLAEISPFEIYPLDDARSISDCRRLAWVRYVDIAEIAILYPKNGDKVVPEIDSGTFRDKMDTLLNPIGTMGSDTSKKAYYKRVYERPSKEYPKGRYIAFAGNIVLDFGDVPNIDLGVEFEMPFIHYKDISIPGRFWGQSTIEQMGPMNIALNRVVNQVVENCKLHNRPKGFFVKGTIVKSAYTDQAGELVEVDMTVPGAIFPRIDAPTSLIGAGTMQLTQLLEKGLMDVGARHEASAGQAQGGANSGVAIGELKESDDSEKGAIYFMEGENAKLVYTMWLKLAHDKYTELRLTKVVGDDKMPEIISFMGADLRSNNDVWVDTDDIVPSTREGRQRFVEGLYKSGILGDPADDKTRKRSLRMMQAGNLDEMWEESSMDARYARAENKKIAQGKPINIHLYDNHNEHILEHVKPLKSPLMDEQSPVRIALRDHIQSHQNFLKGNIKGLTEKEIQELGLDIPDENEMPIAPGGQEQQPAQELLKQEGMAQVAGSGGQ